MKTISFKIEYTNKDSIEYDSRVYSSIVRYAFNRIQENNSTTLTYQDVCSKFDLNSHLCNCAEEKLMELSNDLRKMNCLKSFTLEI